MTGSKARIEVSGRKGGGAVIGPTGSDGQQQTAWGGGARCLRAYDQDVRCLM